MSRIPISSLLNPVDSCEHVARNANTTTTLPQILAPHPQQSGQGYAQQPLLGQSLGSSTGTASSSTNGSSTPESASQKTKNPYSCPLKACGRTFNTSTKLYSHYHREHIPSLREELIAERLKREGHEPGSDRA